MVITINVDIRPPTITKADAMVSADKMASPCSGLIHHLLGHNVYALSRLRKLCNEEG